MNIPTTSPPDLRPVLEAGIQHLIDLAATVRSDQLDRPTPCDDYDVGQLLGHVRAALGRIEQVSRREPVEGGPTDDAIDPATIAADIRTVGEAAIAGWRDDALLSDLVTVPFGTVPGAIAATAYANETLVHAWDLASALGIDDVEWPDEEHVELVLAMFQRALPADARDENVPFGPVVDIADDASAIDQLAAWSGRSPR